MNFKQSFSLAIKSLATSKMRSFLTMLGIIIGVAAVIILVSLVNGFKGMMLNEFESMGTNLITANINSRGSNRTVDFEDMINFVDENGELFSYISPTVSIGAQAKFGTETSSTTSITGVSEDYDKIKNYEISQGRFLQYMDISRRQKNCVVGSYIAKEYFDGNAIGESFKINGNNFTIVGVIEEQASSEEGTADDMVLIPYSLSRALGGRAFIGSYALSAADKDRTEESKAALERFLYSIFKNDSAYMVITMESIVDTVNEMMGMLTSILVGIAGISLLVGGIGIMNIMLVSVTERTREIGIRKSLGAKRIAIMSQFVVEAATTSAIGGVLGIVLGIVASIVASNLLDLDPVISVSSVVIAFTISAGIGVMFGYLPAKKAAKLNPIDALRHD